MSFATRLTSARESARRRNGQFGEQPNTEPEAKLSSPEAWRSTAYVGIDDIPDEPGRKFDTVQPGGYDEIWVRGDGYLRFLRDGKMHRDNGPALFGPEGDYQHWISGQPVVAPQSDLILREIDSEGTQHWESPSGKRTATRTADGYEEHRQDGDLHRDGGPALVHRRGEGDWYQHGTYVECPVPETPRLGSTPSVVGANYNENHSPKDIALGITRLVEVGNRAGMFLPGTQAEITVLAPHGETPTVIYKLTGMDQYRNDAGVLNVEGTELYQNARRQVMSFHHKSYAENNQVVQNFVPAIELGA